MKKVIKTLLVSLGSIALLAGIAGTIYGTNDRVRNWVDEKIQGTEENTFPTYTEDDFESPSSENNSESEENPSGDDSGGGSGEDSGGDEGGGSGENDPGENNPGSQEHDPSPQEFDDENCEINLSKSKIRLYSSTFVTASEAISASIDGNPSDSRLIWTPLNQGVVTVDKLVSDEDEEVTISAGYFAESQTVRVSMLANPSIYKDVTVLYCNEPLTIQTYSIGVSKTKTGNLLKKNELYRFASVETSYTDHDGVYFYSPQYMYQSTTWWRTPEEAIEANNIAHIKASPGTWVELRFRDEVTKNSPPVFRDQYAFTSDYHTWTAPVYTTMEFSDSEVLYERFLDRRYDMLYRFQVPEDFVGQTGKVVVHHYTAYFCIQFDAYYPVTGNSLSDQTIDLGA